MSHDFLYGKEHNDKLNGGDGNDWVEGGTGADEIYGDAGDDTLVADDDPWTDDASADFLFDNQGTNIFWYDGALDGIPLNGFGPNDTLNAH